MPIIVDGIEITEVWVDGVEQDEVIADGVVVFTAGPLIIDIEQGIGDNGGYPIHGYSESLGPFGSIVNDQIKGETIDSVVYYESQTAGNGFWFSIKGNQLSQGEDFLFSSITPNGGDTFVPKIGSRGYSFAYLSGSDTTYWQWNAFPEFPAGWDGTGPQTVEVTFKPVPIVDIIQGTDTDIPSGVTYYGCDLSGRIVPSYGSIDNPNQGGKVINQIWYSEGGLDGEEFVFGVEGNALSEEFTFFNQITPDSGGAFIPGAILPEYSITYDAGTDSTYWRWFGSNNIYPGAFQGWDGIGPISTFLKLILP